jgi:aryl-alcohol dehydrogenase-like predicted oxidoreductase
MKYKKLGRTGLEISEICLGCMSYGESKRGNHEWTVNEEGSRLFIKTAIEQGINFFDTANAYSAGSSEEILGRAIKDFGNRDEVVIATKVFAPMRRGRNAVGLSRKAILAELDASLRRLDMDYIDLYQIHRFDPSSPIEETLEALHDAIRSGKVRYIGASSMYAWQFSKSLYLADLHGWSRFVSMQNHYNLLYREEEREMMPLCQDQGIGVIPWSPMARGKLTRDWEETTLRSETDKFGQALYDHTDSDREIVLRVRRIAAAHGVSRAQVALAWMLQKSFVTAPIIGATKPHHLDDAIAAVDLELTPEEISQLEEPYTPCAVAGFV